jgi:hypothetical protein
MEAQRSGKRATLTSAAAQILTEVGPGEGVESAPLSGALTRSGDCQIVTNTVNVCSSCMTRTISSRSIFSAVHAVMAVAVARRRPPRGEGFFSHEIAVSEKRDGGLFPVR